MSWDIFAQDIPRDVKSVDEIPDDFVPRTLGSRREIVDGILSVAPAADFGDPTWGRIDGPGYSIEVNIGAADPVRSFAMHVSGDASAVLLVQRILTALGVRAFDPSNPSGIFEVPASAEGFARWEEYRAQVVAEPTEEDS